MYIKESLSLISVFVTLTSLRPITLKYNTKITLVNNIYKFSLSLFRKIFLLFECVEESLSLISVFVTLTSLRQITFTQNITRVYTFSFSFLQNIFFRCRCNGKSLSFISWFVTLTSLRPITFTLGCLSLPLSVFRQDFYSWLFLSRSRCLSHYTSVVLSSVLVTPVSTFESHGGGEFTQSREALPNSTFPLTLPGTPPSLSLYRRTRDPGVRHDSFTRVFVFFHFVTWLFARRLYVSFNIHFLKKINKKLSCSNKSIFF